MRDTFVLRTEWYSSIEELSSQEKSELFDAIFLYHLDKEDEINFTSNSAKLCWNFMKPTIDWHQKKYQTAKTNGSLGGAPKGNNNAKKQPKSTKEQPKNNLTVTDTVTDIVTVNDIVIATATGTDIEKELNDVCNKFNIK
jgi:hypothetical protein